jgi:hypothetical protein
MSQNDGISNTYAQRHYLGMSDEAISENMEWKRKDSALKWELDQISGAGPNWREQQEAVSTAATEAGMGGEEASAPIPEFGGGPAPETGTETPAPETGTETPAPETGTETPTPETENV